MRRAIQARPALAAHMALEWRVREETVTGTIRPNCTRQARVKVK
jgi:hypothetical protein